MRGRDPYSRQNRSTGSHQGSVQSNEQEQFEYHQPQRDQMQYDQSNTRGWNKSFQDSGFLDRGNYQPNLPHNTAEKVPNNTYAYMTNVNNPSTWNGQAQMNQAHGNPPGYQQWSSSYQGPPVQGAMPPSGAHLGSHSTQGDIVPAKLSSVKLLKFSGDILSYQEWRQNFQAFCLDNHRMSIQEKMLRLKSSLSGQPSTLLGFPWPCRAVFG